MSTINNPRFFLWAALALLVYADYTAWMHDYGPAPTAQSAAAGAQHPGANAAPADDLANRVPEAAPSSASPGAAAPATAANAPAAAAAAGTVAAGAEAPAAAVPVVHVRTDVLDVLISTRGGTVQQADLLAYPKVKGEPEGPVSPDCST